MCCLSIVFGVLLAIGAAMLLEFVDRRVRTVDEVSELLGLPLLGVLPAPGGQGRFISRATPLVSSRTSVRRLPSPHSETDGKVHQSQGDQHDASVNAIART